MDKRDFVKAFSQEDPYRMAKLFESLERAKNYDFPFLIEEFYTPLVWSSVEKMKEYKEIDVLGEEFLERRVFSVNWMGPSPLKILKITNLMPAVKLEHKNYLGAVLSLGVLREKFGDLFVVDDFAYLIVFEELGNYVKEQLLSVGKCSVSVKLYDYEEKVKDLVPSLQKFEAVVASRRLDVIVAELAKTSRGKALELVERGMVLLNYQECKEKSKEVKPQDTLTIRRKGKFKVGEVLKETQKGNLRMEFYKFL
jgi:RNA-binding protein YlmH